jgi:hypothetical protein
MPMAKKNSITFDPSGAPPEMHIRSCRPRAPHLVGTSRSASVAVTPSSSPAVLPWKRSSATRRPTPSPQWKMRGRSGGWFAAFSMTRAYTFS